MSATLGLQLSRPLSRAGQPRAQRRVAPSAPGKFASPRTRLPARVSERAGRAPASIRMHARSSAVASASSQAFDAAPASPRARRVAIFVEPSPFSHTSGMKNRFLNLIINLREAGDEVRVCAEYIPHSPRRVETRSPELRVFVHVIRRCSSSRQTRIRQRNTTVPRCVFFQLCLYINGSWRRSESPAAETDAPSRISQVMSVLGFPLPFYRSDTLRLSTALSPFVYAKVGMDLCAWRCRRSRCVRRRDREIFSSGFDARLTPLLAFADVCSQNPAAALVEARRASRGCSRKHGFRRDDVREAPKTAAGYLVPHAYTTVYQGLHVEGAQAAPDARNRLSFCLSLPVESALHLSLGFHVPHPSTS